MPGLTIGDSIPNLEVETTLGTFKIHDYIGNSWAIIFSHPGDFTPVCTTELGKMAKYEEEFNLTLLGNDMEEVLRVLDSLQQEAEHKVATPPGDEGVISHTVSDEEEAMKMFPQGFKTVDVPSNRGYFRFAPF